MPSTPTLPPVLFRTLAPLLLALPAALGATAQLPTPPSPTTAPTSAPTTVPTTAPASRPAVPLPAAWHGRFTGVLELRSADKPGVAQPIPSELIISPLPDSPDVAWTLIYNAEQRQERKYTLKAVPGFPGRFLMDEHNGLLIDHALISTPYSDLLACQFGINNALLTSRFELVGDDLHFEIISSIINKPRHSEVPQLKVALDSFPIRSVQKGVLKRVRP